MIISLIKLNDDMLRAHLRINLVVIVTYAVTRFRE